MPAYVYSQNSKHTKKIMHHVFHIAPWLHPPLSTYLLIVENSGDDLLSLIFDSRAVVYLVNMLNTKSESSDWVLNVREHLT